MAEKRTFTLSMCAGREGLGQLRTSCQCVLRKLPRTVGAVYFCGIVFPPPVDPSVVCKCTYPVRARCLAPRLQNENRTRRETHDRHVSRPSQRCFRLPCNPRDGLLVVRNTCH